MLIAGDQKMKLEKLISANHLLHCAIGTTVAEYDIAAAAPTAYRFILGEKVYQDLMAMPKLERNIQTGKMQLEDPTLWKKTEAITIEWFNEFLEVNKIDTNNFVETTRDSILVVGKIPQKLEFQDGKVNFRVKESEGPYSTFFRIDGKLILFDSMKNDIRIKGVSKEYVADSKFVHSYLVPLLSSLESAQGGGLGQTMKVLTKYRDRYIDAKNPEIYRELNNKNQFKHIIENEAIYSDSILDPTKLEKSGNYSDYIMNIIRSVLG